MCKRFTKCNSFEIIPPMKHKPYYRQMVHLKIFHQNASDKVKALSA